MLNRMMGAAAAALLISFGSVALAQQSQQNQENQQSQAASPATDVTQLREFDDQVVERLGITVDELEDMDIIGPDGEEIGEVRDVLVNQQGNIVAMSAELGGVLGVGSREVVLRLDQVGLEQNRRNLVISMTREELEALPVWDD